MTPSSITTKAKLWKWNAMKGSWHFVTLNKTAAAKVEKMKPKHRRGFGSIPVTITVGSSTWKTSLFPDKTRGWVIPIKANVRKKEGLTKGDTLTLTIERDRLRS